MTGSANTLLYLLYGDSREYHLELTYSIVSAVRHLTPAENVRIVLMTDRDGRRDDLPVEHLIFTADEFAGWTDNGRYKHAAKGHAYLAALDHLRGKVALVDTDTYFRRSPSELFKRISSTALMHADEGTLEDQWPGYWDKIVEHFGTSGLDGFRITPKSRMFNSGVIGTCSEYHRERLNHVPLLIDRMFEVDPRVHNIEQFAYSLALGNFGINSCKDVLRHYFGYERRFVHWRLDGMFPEFTRETFDAAVDNYRPVDGFPAKRKMDLALAKAKLLRRRQRKIYGFAYLAYLSAFKETEQGLANAWANASVDALVWNKFPSRMVRADFHKLRPDALSRVAWLHPSTRDRWLAYWSVEDAGWQSVAA